MLRCLAVLLSLAGGASAQLRSVEAPIPVVIPGVSVVAAPAAAPLVLQSSLAFGLPVAPALLGRSAALAAPSRRPMPSIGRGALAGLRKVARRITANPALAAPHLERLFERAQARGALDDGPAAPVSRHFDHADFADDDGFPSDGDGNPLIVPDAIKPLLPSAFDKETWTGRLTFHLHSLFSDGTMTPEEVVEAAYKAGVRTLALTDHDTTAGIQRAWKRARELGLEFHPGAELSARGGVHLGAIDIDVFNPELIRHVETVRQSRLKKAGVIIGNLNKLPELREKGIVLTMAEVEAKSLHAQGGTIEIPHIARVLLDKGLIQNVDDAYDKYLKGDAFKGIDRYPDPTVAEVLKVIHAAGGKAILNHPYTVRPANSDDGTQGAASNFAPIDPKEQDRLIEAILRQGVDGIEVYRPDRATSEEGKRRADERAAKYLLWVDAYSKGKLLIAAPGSDYHGADTHLDRLTVWMPKNLAGQLSDTLRIANAAALESLEAHERGAPPSPPAAGFVPLGETHFLRLVGLIALGAAFVALVFLGLT